VSGTQIGIDDGKLMSSLVVQPVDKILFGTRVLEAVDRLLHEVAHAD
jgi:hypothetical protein